MAIRRTRRSTGLKGWFRSLPWGKILFGGILLAVFGGVALTATWLRICSNDACPPISELDNYDPNQASKVYAADGRLITTIGAERRTLVTLAELSPAVPAAFLATEDKRFYQHHGVDWIRLFGAIRSNVLHLDPTRQGFSTITMQLARNIWDDFLDPSQRHGISGIRRKLREARVAMEIEKKYPKDRILELYLNQINLGSGALGVEAASQRYFGKHASELNLAEAATLASLAKSPELYNPRRYPANSVGRRNLVLQLMQESGVISEDEVRRWQGYPILLSARPDYTGVGEYFVDYVRSILRGQPWGDNLARSGLYIYTTLDLDAQIAAERALSEQLSRIENGEVKGKFPHRTYEDYLETNGSGEGGNNTPYLQGAVLVMEARTGNILAMVGGRDYQDSKFNRISQALRQPGSTFKPIVYTAALESGVSLSDSTRDDRFVVHMPDGQPDWIPENFNLRYSDSMMTLRHALANSINSVAAKVGMEAGIPAVLEEARRFGISAKIDPVPSIMLGSATVKPIELISSYSVFANLGKRTIPNAVVRVEDKNRKVIWKPAHPAPVEVVDPATAFSMNEALRQVITNGTGYSAVWRAGFQIPAGGKTGTTSNLWDTWFVGFTSDLVAGVWIGFDQPQSIMPGAQGGVLAAPAWTQMMLEIYRRRPVPSGWTRPEPEITMVEIDRSTGLRATPFCPDALRQFMAFPKGSEPTEYCRIHTPGKPDVAGKSP